MNIKQLQSNLAKVVTMQAKVVTMQKEIDTILLTTTSSFKKGEKVNFLAKDEKLSGKVLYCVGQKSLTVLLPDNKTKVNVQLSQLIFT